METRTVACIHNRSSEFARPVRSDKHGNPEIPESAEESVNDGTENDPGNSDIDKERLRNVIKAFEDEYQ